jgi:hypothetical protein
MYAYKRYFSFLGDRHLLFERHRCVTHFYSIIWAALVARLVITFSVKDFFPADIR